MIPTPPLRSLFRSRWAALAWAGAICWMAADFAHGDEDGGMNAATSADGNLAQASALLAED